MSSVETNPNVAEQQQVSFKDLQTPEQRRNAVVTPPATTEAEPVSVMPADLEKPDRSVRNLIIGVVATSLFVGFMHLLPSIIMFVGWVLYGRPLN